MKNNREFDIIIWGATGFTGRLVVEYMFKQYGVNGEIKWAIAGRNQSKLEEIRAEMATNTVPMIIADSQDMTSLKAMVQRTKVICTTVGPYAKYGSKLVMACINHQTDYCDLTGEVQWMHKMITEHHEAAKANGTKIVHTCGFDSIPSDLGVYFLQKEAKTRTGQYCQQIKMRVKAMKGEFSGGTYASMNYIMEQAEKDQNILKIMSNPYGLNPKGEQSGIEKPDLEKVMYDETVKGWICPFVMAGVNTRVVRRSNALSGYSYGKDFLYDEATMTGSGMSGRFKGLLVTGAMGIVMSAKPGSMLKNGINRMLPKPGEGPSKEKRESGFYHLLFFGILPDGNTINVEVRGDRDPGYGSTSKILAESAVCLAKDDLPNEAGMLTPSVAMGDALLKRLPQNAGLSFRIK